VIEEPGLIVALEGNTAWVETQRSSACGSCGLLAGAALGAAGAGRWLGPQVELVSIITGALGLIGGLLWGRRFGLRTQRDRRYQAVVIRRLGVGSVRVHIHPPSGPNPAVS
jgi:positive regulator of sigma E activity